MDFINPGSPFENSFIESFNGKLRDECLNEHWFTSLDDARELIESREINSNGLLLIATDLTREQAVTLLTESSKPVILLQRDIPDAEVLELVKETESALGLILEGDQSPSDYFLKMDRLVNEIGMDHVMVVNEQPLMDGRGREQMMGVVSKMLEAGYAHLDNYLDYRMINLFSGTFMRVLEASK